MVRNDVHMHAESLQSCLTLCKPARLLCPWDTRVGCHALLQEIFLTHVSYISCIGKQVLYH